MAIAGSVNIILQVLDQKFNAGMNAAGAKLKGFSKTAQVLTRELGSVSSSLGMIASKGPALGAVAIGLFAIHKALNGVADRAQEISDEFKRTGVVLDETLTKNALTITGIINLLGEMKRAYADAIIGSGAVSKVIGATSPGVGFGQVINAPAIAAQARGAELDIRSSQFRGAQNLGQQQGLEALANRQQRIADENAFFAQSADKGVRQTRGLDSLANQARSVFGGLAQSAKQIGRGLSGVATKDFLGTVIRRVEFERRPGGALFQEAQKTDRTRRFAAAMEFGSAEARSAILGTGKQDTEKKQLTTQKQMLSTLQEIAKSSRGAELTVVQI